MKRVVIRTETRESDGAITSTTREEETQDSGLLEAWGFLALLLASLLFALLTWRVVSGIVASRPRSEEQDHYPTEETYAIQRGQTESAKLRPHPLRAGTGHERGKRQS